MCKIILKLTYIISVFVNSAGPISMSQVESKAALRPAAYRCTPASSAAEGEDAITPISPLDQPISAEELGNMLGFSGECSKYGFGLVDFKKAIERGPIKDSILDVFFVPAGKSTYMMKLDLKIADFFLFSNHCYEIAEFYRKKGGIFFPDLLLEIWVTHTSEGLTVAVNEIINASCRSVIAFYEEEGVYPSFPLEDADSLEEILSIIAKSPPRSLFSGFSLTFSGQTVQQKICEVLQEIPRQQQMALVQQAMRKIVQYLKGKVSVMEEEKTVLSAGMYYQHREHTIKRLQEAIKNFENNLRQGHFSAFSEERSAGNSGGKVNTLATGLCLDHLMNEDGTQSKSASAEQKGENKDLPDSIYRRSRSSDKRENLISWILASQPRKPIQIESEKIEILSKGDYLVYELDNIKVIDILEGGVILTYEDNYAIGTKETVTCSVEFIRFTIAGKKYITAWHMPPGGGVVEMPIDLIDLLQELEKRNTKDIKIFGFVTLGEELHLTNAQTIKKFRKIKNITGAKLLRKKLIMTGYSYCDWNNIYIVQKYPADNNFEYRTVAWEETTQGLKSGFKVEDFNCGVVERNTLSQGPSLDNPGTKMRRGRSPHQQLNLSYQEKPSPPLHRCGTNDLLALFSYRCY